MSAELPPLFGVTFEVCFDGDMAQEIAFALIRAPNKKIAETLYADRWPKINGSGSLFAHFIPTSFKEQCQLFPDSNCDNLQHHGWETLSFLSNAYYNASWLTKDVFVDIVTPVQWLEYNRPDLLVVYQDELKNHKCKFKFQDWRQWSKYSESGN